MTRWHLDPSERDMAYADADLPLELPEAEPPELFHTPPRVRIFALSSQGITCMSFSPRAWSQARAGIEREWEVYSVHLEGDLAA